MLKMHSHTFSLLQRCIDLFAVFTAWFCAYIMRFYLLSGGEPGLELFFIKLTPIVLILALYFFNKESLYKSNRFKSQSREILALFQANLQSFLAFVLILYFFAPNRVSRIVLITYFIFSIIFTTTLRIAYRKFLREIRKKGKNLRHVLLVGHGEQLIKYVENALGFRESGLNFIAWIDSNDLSKKYNIPHSDLSIQKLKERHAIDTIVLGFDGENFFKVEQIVKESHKDIIPIQILPPMHYSFVGTTIDDFAGIPLITVNTPNISDIDLFLKRIFDFTLSSIGLIAISPLLIFISFLVKITSRGPIFYGQERMSVDGRKFMMWKFRSMRVDAEKESGAVWAVKNDNRRTPIGTLLRSTSLDELPQIWNVIVGDMSLVGPRPERPIFVEKFKDEIPAYMLRHKMKAGITGWAQVNGWRGDTSLEKRIECDIYYIKNWSLLFDIKIIFLTFWKGLINKNAY